MDKIGEIIGQAKDKLGPYGLYIIAAVIVIFFALRSRSGAAPAAAAEAPLSAGGYGGGGGGGDYSGGTSGDSESYQSILDANYKSARDMQALSLEGASAQYQLNLQEAKDSEALRQQASIFDFGQEKEAGLFGLDLAKKQNDIDAQKTLTDLAAYKDKGLFDFGLGQQSADAQLNRDIFSETAAAKIEVQKAGALRAFNAQDTMSAIDAQIAALGARPEVRGRNFLTGKRAGAKEAAEYDKAKNALLAQRNSVAGTKPVDTSKMFSVDIPNFSYTGRGA